MSQTQNPWDLLKEPFKPEEIHQKQGGGGQMLDYVGHAEVTERLNKVDPTWTWAPVGFGDDGAPAVRWSADSKGNRVLELWGFFTVLGVTRTCVGTCKADSYSGETAKELISDLIRNGAMRAGVALDLWKRTGVAPAAEAGGNTSQSNQSTGGVSGAVAARASSVGDSGGAATAGQVKMINRLRFYTAAKFPDEEFAAQTFSAVGTEYTEPAAMSFRDATMFISILKERAGETDSRPPAAAPAADAPPPDDSLFDGFDQEPF